MDSESDPRLISIRQLWNQRMDLTQRSAARELGISQSAVCQYLSGKIPLNLEIIIKFSKLFSVKPFEIDPDLDF
jgi:predicted transcriptional regulator